MSAVELLQPILDGGLERNNFFNGRLLSAEDLRAEQDASRVQYAHLARAVGDGVAWGLSVSVLNKEANRPRVKVTSGLALNRLGNLLYLPDDAEVTLVPDRKAVDVAVGLFVECEPPRATGALTGEGAYVLVVSPTSGYRGTALVSDPNTTAAGRGACGARFSVEGVRFRLVSMALSALEGVGAGLRARGVGLLPPTTDPARERLRNILAHVCFGTEALAGYFADPLRVVGGQPAWAGWGALDAMRNRGDLTDCDVPLAIVVLTSAGISFTDTWPVRRKLVDASAVDTWRAVAGPRRMAEGEATFLQFQSHLEALKLVASPTSMAASTYLDVLPAGGWLPTGTGGFTWSTFFGPHAPPAVTPVDAALLRGILERSWFDEPFTLATNPPVPVRVYQVPGESFVVFARSHNGNIRVFLSPAPAASELVDVTATAATGPHVRATTRSGGTVAIPDLPPGRHVVTVTAPDYEAVTPRDVDVVGGRTVDLAITMSPLPNGKIVVDATDMKTGVRIPANKIVSITASGGGQTFPAVLQSSTGKWLIANVPAGTYSLHGIASGYRLATGGSVVPVARGTEIAVPLVFEPEPGRAPQPPKCVSVKEVRRPPLTNVLLCLVLPATEFEETYYFGERAKQAAKSAAASGKFGIAKRSQSERKQFDTRYASATGEIVYARESWEDMVPLERESDEVRKWLFEWCEWFAEELDDPRIREARPVVYLDRDYKLPTNVSGVPRRPPGYAVFSRFGVPLAIEPKEGLVKAPMKIERAGLRGLPPETVKDLYAVDIIDIDDLAWAWEELIVDATGDPPDTVRYLIQDAATMIGEINQERRYYEGVDKDVDRAMKDLGILDDVALANADVDKLGDKVGSKSFAMRLIQKARSIVPKDSWSLDGLGLTRDQAEVLVERGIDSKGALTASAGRAEGKAAIAKAMGLDAESVATRDAAIVALTNEAVTMMSRRSVELAPEMSVALWKGIDATTAAKLTVAGFATIEELAAATPEAVAAATSIAPDVAGRLVSDAKGVSRAALGVGVVSVVSKAEERGLVAILGADSATVGALAAKTPEELAGAFGGNVARAAAILNGIRAGLAVGGIG